MIYKTNNKIWLLISFGLTILVVTTYIFAFYNIGFYYDDYVMFRNYSNAELIKSLTGDWNFGQRLENAGYRPLFNIIFHLIWNLLGTNVFYYRILSILLVILSGFLAYKIFFLYIKDRILIFLGAILFVIFSDQFTHRIWLTEFPSFISNILSLLGIYIVAQKQNSRSIKVSYFLIIIAASIKETNLPFLLVPIVSQLFNKENFKITYSILMQLLFVGIFVVLFIYVRSTALNNLSLYAGIHPYEGLVNTIVLIKEFIIGFAPSLGLSKIALAVVICLLFVVCFVNIFLIKDVKLWKFSGEFYFITILIILSTASFPFVARGTLRVLFVCFSLLALLIFLSKFNKGKPFVSYILISFLILLNCINSYRISKGLIPERDWIAQSIYFSPYYRNFIHRGNADKLLLYLEENDLDGELVSSYNNLISSLSEKTTIIKTGEFIDDLGIEFVSLRIGRNKELNIMKYEFRVDNLNGYLLSTQSTFNSWKKKPDFPFNGVRHYRIDGLIKHLNEKSEKYKYRLPKVQEYVWLTGGYNTIFEENSNKFASKDIEPVFNTIPNEFGIYGLQGNVSEWTNDYLDLDYAVLFGGDAHSGSHNIVFSDHKRRSKAGTARLYGFRLVTDTINNQ